MSVIEKGLLESLRLHINSKVKCDSLCPVRASIVQQDSGEAMIP